MMKILAAFDSFKESMTAYAAGEAVQRAYNSKIIHNSEFCMNCLK